MDKDDDELLRDWLAIASASGAFSFWDNDIDDVYDTDYNKEFCGHDPESVRDKSDGSN